VPTFLASTANALAAEPQRDADGRISSSCSSTRQRRPEYRRPYADDGYASIARNCGLEAKAVAKIDDRIGFHPAWPLRETAGKPPTRVVQSVGYPNPNRSHFESMAIWHTARRTRSATRRLAGARTRRQTARPGAAFPPCTSAGIAPQALVGSQRTSRR